MNVSVIMKPVVLSVRRVTPPCHTCKYFDKGKCKIFASQNPVTSDLVYTDVQHTRSNKSLCGPDGKYYKEK